MKLEFGMLRTCVYMHSSFIENHPIRILEDGSLISKVVLSHPRFRLGCQKVVRLVRRPRPQVF
jgi:hypothetical protein